MLKNKKNGNVKENGAFMKLIMSSFGQAEVEVSVKFLGAHTALGGKHIGFELRRCIWPIFDGHQYITVYNKELNGFTKGQHIEYENKKARTEASRP